MKMARVTYKASPDNKPWSPAIIPDTSDRILKQSEDYIEKLKAARNLQAAQDADFIQKYTASIDRGIQSQRAVDQEQEKQARALAEYKQGLLRDQARRAQSIGGSVTGDDNKTMKWIEFITEASGTAAQAFGEIAKQRDKADEVIATELRSRFSVYDGSIGNNYQVESQRIGDQRSFAAALIAEQRGDIDLANDLRKMTPGQKAHFDRLRGVDVGRQMMTNFEQDMYAQESVMDVMINGQLKPFNQIRGTREMQLALPQYRDYHFRKYGLDPTSELMTKGLATSQEVFETRLGEIKRDEIAADKENLLDQSETAFTIRVQNPDEAQAAAIDLYQDTYNLNGGNHKEARKAVMEVFKDPAKTSEKAFLAWQQTVLPGQTKDVEFLYGDEIDEVAEARINRSTELIDLDNKQQQNEAQEEANRVNRARLADVDEDNDVDLSPENVQAQIDKYTALGPNWSKAKEAWQDLIPSLSSEIRDKELDKEFQYLEDRGALDQTFVRNSDASEKKKVEWFKKINARAQQEIDEEERKEFKAIARAMLMRRTGEEPGQDGSSNNDFTKRALRRALDDWDKDYVTATQLGRNDPQMNPAKYAEERFNARFENPEGLYAVSSISDKVGDGKLAVGRFINFGPTATEAIDNPFGVLGKKIQQYGSEVYDKRDVISYETLDQVSKAFKTNNKIVIPPPIVFLAESSGGKLSVMDVLNRQLEANDLDQIPPNIYGTVKAAESSINPVWLPRLNYKPTFETVDAAMVGSGLESFYSSTTPAQEQVKAIFGKRESPNDGYDAINRGEANDTPGGATARYGRPLTQMTLGEVKQLQALELNAVGRYQFVERTLAEAAADAGITDDMLFNEAVQDRIFFVHLDKYGAYGPWERWWIEQGGPELKLTPEEQQIIEAFRASYDPSNPWRQPKNLNPAVIPAIPQEEPVQAN